MGSICGGSKKISKDISLVKGNFSYHQYIDNLTNTQIQLLTRIYQDLQPIDYSSFRKLSPNFPELAEEVLESAFRLFDTDKSGRISLSGLCSIVSKYTLGSRQAKCEFLYKVFNFIDAKVLVGPQLAPLRNHCEEHLRPGKSTEAIDGLIASFSPLTLEEFTKWALQNLDINEAMSLFEIIPSPVTERNTIHRILEKYPVHEDEGSIWAIISFRWIYAWKQYVNYGERVHDYEELQSIRAKSIIIGARPIEIDNSVLSDQEHPVQLRRNLKVNTDYELIPVEAWKELLKWYGGGPEYIREVLNGTLNLYPPILNIKFKDRSRNFTKSFCVSKNETVGNIVKTVAEKNINNYTFYIRTGDFYRPLGHNFTLAHAGVDGVTDCYVTNSKQSVIPASKISEEVFEEGDAVEYQEHVGWIPLTIKRITETSYILSAAWRHQDIVVLKTNQNALRKPARELLRSSYNLQVKGLCNLGNTCYLNAVFQCIIHTPLLFSYFSEEAYVKHLNIRNSRGSSGKIAREFGTFLRSMRTSNLSYYKPTRFLREFSHLHEDFRDFQQQDSHEFLRILLDTLHEDLNRIDPSTPGIQTSISLKNPSVDEAKQASRLLWDKMQGQIGSVISDLFGGQTERSLVCKKCNETKAIFEQIMDMSVPVPIDECEFIVTITLVPRFATELKRFRMRLHENITFAEISDKISNSFKLPLESLIFGKVYLGKINSLFFPKTAEEFKEKHYEIYAFEVIRSVEEAEQDGRLTILPADTNLTAWPEDIAKSQQVDYCYSENWVSAVVTRVYGRMIDIKLDDDPGTELCISLEDSKIAPFRRHTSNDNKIVILPCCHFRMTGEGMSYFGSPFLLSKGNWYSWSETYEAILESADRFIFKARKSIARPYSVKLFNKDSIICALCNVVTCQGCEFPKKNSPIHWLYQSMDKVTIAIVWKMAGLYFLPTSYEKEELKDFDIFACLEEFTKEENIELTCEKCKHKQHISKTEIWKLPDVLIIHFKRFQFNGRTFEKINNLIKFPLTAFDITPWMHLTDKSLGITMSNSKDNYTYDLCAVINHTGSVYGGHYTSFCLDENNQTWLEFDDERVYRVSGDLEKEIVTSKAYILFYRRKRFASSSIVNLSNID